MKKYFRKRNHTIVAEGESKKLNKRFIHSLIDQGIPFILIDDVTKEDITEDIRRQNMNRKLGDNDQILDPRIYGPDKPLNEVKYYSCNNCEKKTTNRFKCTECWDVCTDNTDEYFIYDLI
jgi:hypothetical protein